MDARRLIVSYLLPFSTQQQMHEPNEARVRCLTEQLRFVLTLASRPKVLLLHLPGLL